MENEMNNYDDSPSELLREEQAERKQEKRANTPHSLSQYIKEIPEKYTDLAEDLELGRLARRGDDDAKNEMIVRNLRFVIFYAKRYLGRGLEFEDLIEEGNLAMLTAAEKYDPGKGVKFVTYAGWWIKQGIERAIMDQKAIRIPVHHAEQVNRLIRSEKRFEKRYGREPAPNELSRMTGYTIKKINYLKSLPKITLSLEDVMAEGEHGGIELIRAIENDNSPNPEDAVSEKERRENILGIMNVLDEREQHIVLSRFGFYGKSRTLEDLGKEFGLTRERVRQIEKGALNKLKGPRMRKKLEALLN